MVQQDELAGLFDRSMNFSNPTPPPEERQAVQQEVPKRVYASTHYVPNHTVAATDHPQHSTPQPSPSPEPQIHALSDQQIIDVLTYNNIDPHALLPTQVELVRHADDDQRLRLLELWRISPPAYNLEKEQSAFIQTTLQQEEQAARLRYERAVLAAAGHKIERPSTAPEARSRPSTSCAEPYMMSGYEMLAQREYERGSPGGVLAENSRYNQATDPAYRGNWAGVKSGQEEMENSYGAFEMRRDNQTGGALNGLDEEMVM